MRLIQVGILRFFIFRESATSLPVDSWLSGFSWLSSDFVQASFLWALGNTVFCRDSQQFGLNYLSIHSNQQLYSHDRSYEIQWWICNQGLTSSSHSKLCPPSWDHHSVCLDIILWHKCYPWCGSLFTPLIEIFLLR